MHRRFGVTVALGLFLLSRRTVNSLVGILPPPYVIDFNLASFFSPVGDCAMSSRIDGAAISASMAVCSKASSIKCELTRRLFGKQKIRLFRKNGRNRPAIRPATYNCVSKTARLSLELSG